MKKVLHSLTILLVVGSLFAQSPHLMSYQAVVRKNDNKLVVNGSVGVQLSLLQGSVNGSLVYEEHHSTTTNDNGLMTLKIGGGIVTKGTFAAIDWTKGPYYIKSEIDPFGGNAYSISSTTQLLSVPYALYSEQSGSTFKHYIGELYGGGVIFYLFKDKNGEEHGLIVTLENLSSGVSWSNNFDSSVGSSARSTWNGQQNTNAIINQSGHFESAAQVCEDATVGEQNDWYLPSLDELNLLYRARYEVNKSLDSDNDPSTKPITYYDYLWSSTEAQSYSAWCKHFATGVDNTNGKDWQYAVRGVRAF